MRSTKLLATQRKIISTLHAMYQMTPNYKTYLRKLIKDMPIQT